MTGAAPAAGAARIAMWSGPRTISTALMRSFSRRADTVAVDEPLYAYYLTATGLRHPGRAEILQSMSANWPDVVDTLTRGPLPAGAKVSYQKHMAHHLLPEVDAGRLAGLSHAFLIRDPRRLLASYARVRSAPALADLGLARQTEIFRQFGGPVIDAAEVLRDPPGMLAALCGALRLEFDPAMLSWPAGPDAADGVWAPHWYASVWASTGFAPYAETAPPDLPAELETLAAQCQPYYEELAGCRLRP